MIGILRAITDSFDLRLLRKVLIGFCVVMFTLITLDQVFLALRPRFVSRYDSSSELPFSSQKMELEPLQVFQDAVERRNLFNVAAKPEGMAVKRSSILDLAKDYRLKGVAFFDVPEAIVEDARTGSTVFVKEGEKVAELTVKEIKEESLVFSYGDEEQELKIQGGDGP